MDKTRYGILNASRHFIANLGCRSLSRDIRNQLSPRLFVSALQAEPTLTPFPRCSIPRFHDHEPVIRL